MGDQGYARPPPIARGMRSATVPTRWRRVRDRVGAGRRSSCRGRGGRTRTRTPAQTDRRSAARTDPDRQHRHQAHLATGRTAAGTAPSRRRGAVSSQARWPRLLPILRASERSPTPHEIDLRDRITDCSSPSDTPVTRSRGRTRANLEALAASASPTPDDHSERVHRRSARAGSSIFR